MYLFSPLSLTNSQFATSYEEYAKHARMFTEIHASARTQVSDSDPELVHESN